MESRVMECRPLVTHVRVYDEHGNSHLERRVTQIALDRISSVLMEELDRVFSGTRPDGTPNS